MEQAAIKRVKRKSGLNFPISSSSSSSLSSSSSNLIPPADLISNHDLANIIRANLTQDCGTDNKRSKDEDNKSTLVLDCRSFLEYNSSHILTAINICSSKIVKRRLQRNQMKVKQLLEHSSKKELLTNRISKIIIYDSSGISNLISSSGDNFVTILISKLKSWLGQNIPISFLSDGFISFKCNYFNLCFNSTNVNSSSLSSSSSSLSLNLHADSGATFTHVADVEVTESGPSEILPFLYLGSLKDAQDQNVLRKLGITWELNVSSNCCKSDWIEESKFLRIPVNDNHQEQLLQFFPLAFEFLENVRLKYNSKDSGRKEIREKETGEERRREEERREKEGEEKSLKSGPIANEVTGTTCSSLAASAENKKCSFSRGHEKEKDEEAEEEKEGKKEEEEEERTGRALIHCLAGISRSASVAIGYLMKHKFLSLDDSYRYVKIRRPTISPNFNFLGQLHEYEKQLKAAGHPFLPSQSQLHLDGIPDATSAAQMFTQNPEVQDGQGAKSQAGMMDTT